MEKEEKDRLLSYIEEVLDHSSQKLVGKTMKRFEILTNQELLKKEIKELIYESYREMSDIFYAYKHGYEAFIYKQIKSKD